MGYYLIVRVNVVCGVAAASSVLTDDVDSDYLHASISGMGSRRPSLHIQCLFQLFSLIQLFMMVLIPHITILVLFPQFV